MKLKTRLTAVGLRERLYRRRYLVPNAVTVGSMFCGFLSLVYAASTRYDQAAQAILIAIILDGLDGRVARRLNATSKFGVEFDSFADLISFGLAPGFLMYQWCLRPVADEFGVFVTFVYALCAACRLVRFNLAQENLKSFVGLPSPGAAAGVAALVHFMPEAPVSTWMVPLVGILVLSLGFLMVSNFEFLSIKRLKLRTMHPLVTIAIGGSLALIWYNHRIGLLTVAAVYALSGPVMWVSRGFKKKPADKIEPPMKLVG